MAQSNKENKDTYVDRLSKVKAKLPSFPRRDFRDSLQNEKVKTTWKDAKSLLSRLVKNII